MESKKKIVRIVCLILGIVLVVLALVAGELLLNAAMRSSSTKSDAAFDKAGLEAVALKNPPAGSKTEENNFAAAVLWTLKCKGRAGELTEAQIFEQVGDTMGEFELYNALETYMPNAKREQRRNLKRSEILQKIHENLKENRIVLATAEDGSGGARYLPVVSYDPEASLVGVYDLERGERVEMGELDFLNLLDLDDADAETARRIAFGEITVNAIMTVY